MRAFGAVLAGGGTWLLVACNAALGIEPAEIYESGGAPGTGGSGGKGSGASAGTSSVPPYPFVAKESACSDCMTACATELAACSTDIACRYKLNEYTACLAKTPDAACVEKLPADIAICLGSNCAPVCDGSALATRCELYCACMAGECADFPVADCTASCDKLSFAKQDCIFIHCQVAGNSSAGSRETHCKHARRDPNFDVCRDSVDVCTSGFPSSFACATGDECCSRSCNVSGVCD